MNPINNTNIDIANSFSEESLHAIRHSLEFSYKNHQSISDIWDLYHIIINKNQIIKLFAGDTTLLKKIIPNNSKSEISKTSIRTVKASNEFQKILLLSFLIANRFGRKIVHVEDIFLAYFEHPATMPYLSKLGIGLTSLQKNIMQNIGGDMNNNQDTSTPVLNKYSIDMTYLARMGNINKIIGREIEIGQIVRILSKESRMNVILVGEDGVGKKSIISGLATYIAEGKIPLRFINTRIISLNLAQLFSLAASRNEIEATMSMIIKELEKNTDIILILEDIHILVDQNIQSPEIAYISNILKPSMIRGDIQIIGTTSITNYRKNIETDQLVSKRFEIIKIGEPNIEESIKIVKIAVEKFEKFHNVRFDAESITAAVELSKRYLTEEFLPQKAINLLDEASVNNTGKIIKSDNIRKILAEKTGIPIEKLNETESQKLSSLEEILQNSVKGQDEAIYKVAEVIRRSRAGLKDSKKPIGSFLFLGQSGVGKTELAKTIAKIVYDSEKAMIRLDMSEFSEQHTVQRLVGAPPGYIGYEEGGQLTNPVWERPYSLVLLDEIEKSHPKVLDIFLQVLDDGRLTDGKGRTVDFKNTIIIATSNLAADLITKLQMGGNIDGTEVNLKTNKLTEDDARAQFRFGLATIMKYEKYAQKVIIDHFSEQNNNPFDKIRKASKKDFDEIKPVEIIDNSFVSGISEKLYKSVLPYLKQHMRTEFINRFDEVIIFNPLSKEALANIADIQFKKIEEKLLDKHLKIIVSQKTKDEIVEKSYSPQMGARPLLRTIQERIENSIARKIIKGEIKDGDSINF